ncbi:biopolymer transporter ExbD [Actibacterium sp. 188UL27-1]|uniref:ExbD/TolR family protein n=1 Tax=Actibacterium sp. 188UL27-1 TaxID=2786961 RepID=UPI00195D45DA|nr:biopolymer transporter ExbD [Actibacterium sp. 188UL27-1]MBM7068844.1 biopolymer transporter ExbD [Actibacterium sp. 188UL27-1]
MNRGDATFTINLPRRRPAAAFALTPLADVMFQLLIFFMLSTSLAPYALVPLGAPTAPEAATGSQNAAPTSRSQVIWHVSRGEVRAGSAILTMAELRQAIPALKDHGLTEVLLFSTPQATAQDVATVIEAIRVGQVARVRLIARPGRLSP